MNFLAHIIRGSSVIAIANGLSKFFALGFIVIVGRLLGPEEYGNLALILSLGAIASTIPSTAFPQALLLHIGSTIGARDSRWTAMLTASAGTGLLAILTASVVILLPNIPWLVVAIILADSIIYLFLNFQQGLLNYRQVALFSMGRNLVKLVLLSLFWFGIPNYEWNHSHIVIIYLLSPLLVITLLELLIPSGISFRTMTFDRLLFNKMSAYGMPIAGSAVALAILMQGDVVLLEYFHGEATTGNYYAARQLFLPVMLLPIAFRGLLVPAIAGNRLSLDNWRKPATIVLGTAAFVAVIAGLTGPLLVEVVYGPDFEAEQSLTLTICASAWILSAKGIIEAVILGHGRSLRMLLANATAAATALVTYLWIIPANGTSGAAQALLLSSTVALLSTTVAFVTLETEDRAPALVGSGNGDD